MAKIIKNFTLEMFIEGENIKNVVRYVVGDSEDAELVKVKTIYDYEINQSNTVSDTIATITNYIKQQEGIS